MTVEGEGPGGFIYNGELGVRLGGPSESRHHDRKAPNLRTTAFLLQGSAEKHVRPRGGRGAYFWMNFG